MGPSRRARRSAYVLLGVFPGSAAAYDTTAWHVPGEGGDTIAETLEVASPWDTLFVDAENYVTEGPVTISYDIGIQSLDGSDVAYPAFVVVGATLRLDTGSVTTTDLLQSGGDLYAGVFVYYGTFEGSDLTFSDGYGYGVYGVDATVQLDDSELSGFYGPAVVMSAEASDAYLTVRNTDFADNSYGSVYFANFDRVANYAVAELVNVDFVGGSAPEYGGDIYAWSLDRLTLTGGSSTDATASYAGGSIFASDSNLTISDMAFDGASAGLGGAIYVGGTESNPSLTINGGTFTGGAATDKGGVGGQIATDNTLLVLDGTDSTGGVAAYGAFLFANGGTVEIREARVRSAESTIAGAIFLDGVSSATIAGTEVCGNAAAYGSAVYGYGSSASITTSLIHGNQAAYGAAVEIVDGRLDVFDDTFVANAGPYGAVAVSTGEISVVNDIFVASATGVSLDDVTVAEAGYNLYWDLEYPDSGYSTLGGDLALDPRFVETYTPGACGSEPWLAAGSPAVDAGDPGRLDEDGGPSDIGAYDGEGEDTGVVGPDDTGETGGPGETGVPDADGDGTPDGDDCAPEDPDIHPDAYDDPLDDLDQDCDGDAASGLARGGCGCDGVGHSPGGLVLLGGAGLLVRRRRGP